MIKFMPIVLYFLYCLSKITSAPIIKATGVQWSEPKGTGKGNITLIMIPQNNSCGDDGDLIVAVKSDYQIQSQDTQLLNLVVNENESVNKSLSKNDKGVNCNKINETQAGNNIKACYDAKYFEPVINAGDKNVNDFNVSSNYSNTDQKEIKGATINILNFIGLTSPNSGLVYSNTATSKSNLRSSAHSAENVLRFVNITEPVDETSNKARKEFEGSGPSLMNSESNFLNEAFNLLDKLKQDPQNNDSLKYNKVFINANEQARGGDSTLLDSKTEPSKEDHLGFDEREILVREFELPNAIKNDKVNLAGDPGDVTTCIPFEIAMDQKVAESKAPSSLDGEIEQTTSGSDFSSFTSTAITLNGGQGSISAVDTKVTQAELLIDTNSIPLAGKENTPKLEAANIDQTNMPSSAEKCSTVIVQCDVSGSDSVFEEISHMVNENKKIEVTTPVISVTNYIGAGFGNVVKTSTECAPVSGVGGNPEPVNQEPPKKVTLVPHIDCATYEKSTGQLITTSSVGNHEAGLKERDLNPLVESSVFLANNVEMPSGKKIPVVLNTSFDEYSLTDFQEKGDKIHGRVAEFYNNNPLVLNIERGKLLDPRPMVIKYKDETKISNQSPNRAKEKILYPDINEILKMHSAGKKIILEQKQSYRAGVSNEECDHTQESKTESLNLEMEPDDEESPEFQTHPTKEITTKRLEVSEPQNGYTTTEQAQEEVTTKHLKAEPKTDNEKKDLFTEKSTTKKLSTTKQLNDKKLNEKSTTKQSERISQSGGAGEIILTTEKYISLKLDTTTTEVENTNLIKTFSTKHSESTPQTDEMEESIGTHETNTAKTLGTTKKFGTTKIHEDNANIKQKSTTKYSGSTSPENEDEYNLKTSEEASTKKLCMTTQTDEEEENRLITSGKTTTGKLSSIVLKVDNTNCETPLEKSTTNNCMSTGHKDRDDSALMTRNKQDKTKSTNKPDFTEDNFMSEEVRKGEKLQTKLNSVHETTTINFRPNPVICFDDSLPAETTKKSRTTYKKLKTNRPQDNLSEETRRTTFASTFSKNCEEELQAQYPVKNITQEAGLHTTDDSNKVGANNIRYTSELPFNKDKCTSNSVKGITDTATEKSVTRTTSKYKTDETHKSLRIPANSINEIVIQIVRNTRKPKELHGSGSEKCQKAELKQYGRSSSGFEIAEQERYRGLQRTPFLGLNSNGNNIKSTNSRLIRPLKYSQNEQPADLRSPKANMDNLSMKEVLPVLSRNSVVDEQSEINSCKRKEISKEKIMAKLNRPIKIMADHKKLSLASNILKVLATDKEKIKSI